MNKVFGFITTHRDLITANEIQARLNMFSERYIAFVLKGQRYNEEILKCAESIIKEKAEAVLAA